MSDKNEVILSRLNLNNNEEMLFLYEVRINYEVRIMLQGPPPKSLSEHFDYLNHKNKKNIFVIYNKKECDNSHNGKVGYCHALVNEEEKTCELGWAIHSYYRGKGNGKAAVESLINIAKNWLGEEYDIILYVLKKNYSAIGLYEKFGFESLDLDNYKDDEFVKMVLKK